MKWLSFVCIGIMFLIAVAPAMLSSQISRGEEQKAAKELYDKLREEGRL